MLINFSLVKEKEKEKMRFDTNGAYLRFHDPAGRFARVEGLNPSAPRCSHHDFSSGYPYDVTGTSRLCGTVTKLWWVVRFHQVRPLQLLVGMSPR